MLQLKCTGLILTPVNALDCAEGSIDVQVQIEFDNTYAAHTKTLHIGYFDERGVEHGVSSSLENNVFKIPGPVFAQAGIIFISVHFSKTGDTTELETNAVQYRVQKTAGGVGSLPASYIWEPVVKRFVNDYLNSNEVIIANESMKYSFLNGLKYVALGDSIVDNQGTTALPETFGEIGYTTDLQGNDITQITVNGYIQAIEKRYGLVCSNYGTGGGTIVSEYGEAFSIDYRDVALVTIAIGVNDARTGVPLGDVNSNDITTFAGCMNNLLQKIYTDNPECRVVVLTPIQRLYVSEFGIATPNKNGHYLIDFVDMCIKVAKKRSTKYIDMYRDCGINQTNLSYYTVEGVHPLNTGYLRMTNAIIPVLDDMFTIEFNPFAYVQNGGNTEPDEPDEPDTPIDPDEPDIPQEEPTGSTVNLTELLTYDGYCMDGWGITRTNVFKHAKYHPLPNKSYTLKTYVPVNFGDVRIVSWSLYDAEQDKNTAGNYLTSTQIGNNPASAYAQDLNKTETINGVEYTVLTATFTTKETFPDNVVINIPCAKECVEYVELSYI